MYCITNENHCLILYYHKKIHKEGSAQNCSRTERNQMIGCCSILITSIEKRDQMDDRNPSPGTVELALLKDTLLWVFAVIKLLIRYSDECLLPYAPQHRA